MAQSDRGRRAAARADRQSQFRQSGAARGHGRTGRLHRGHRRGGAGARLPGRLRQCLALQRDDGLRHSADPRDRRRRPRRRRGEDGEPRFQGGGRGHSGSSAERRAGSAAPPGSRRSQAAKRARRRRSISRPSAATANLSPRSSATATVSAVHDLSDGGLAVALAEMAMAGGIGATVEAAGLEPCVLLRRGSGPLRFDRARRPSARRSPRRRNASAFRSRASASPAATP